jgi:hypothetical protein
MRVRRSRPPLEVRVREGYRIRFSELIRSLRAISQPSIRGLHAAYFVEESAAPDVFLGSHCLP